MKVAVAGCCHGHLDDIYATLLRAQEREGVSIDLLLCCGDFQAVRNSEDLNCMAVPNKYKTIGDYYKYYSGEAVAPILTVFIGGNHEASNHMRELGYGGWVAPNIYYLGYAGVVWVGGVRIVGLSGIYKSGDYHKGHYEAPPYDPGSLRSAYHVKSCDVFCLKQLTGPIDIMLSHDWPTGIHRHGNTEQLLRAKPFLREDVESNELGSPPAEDLLQYLQPSYWFSAHLHCKFSAVYHHEGSGNITKFLALDKPLPRRGFLQIVDIPTGSHDQSGDHSPVLRYDPEWLGVVRLTHSIMPFSRQMWLPPTSLSDDRVNFTPTESDLAGVKTQFDGDFTIPANFAITSPPHVTNDRVNFYTVAVERENPQTVEFCSKLGIENPFRPKQLVAAAPNPDEITLDSSSSGEDADGARDKPVVSSSSGVGDQKQRDQGPEARAAVPGGRYPWLDDDDNGDTAIASHDVVVSLRRRPLLLPPPQHAPPTNETPPTTTEQPCQPSSSNPDELELPSDDDVA